jgi:hypothetical protein
MKINMSKEWLKASKLDLENIKYIIEVKHLTSYEIQNRRVSF